MKFPSDLNCDGKIVSEMGPRYKCVTVVSVLEPVPWLSRNLIEIIIAPADHWAPFGTNTRLNPIYWWPSFNHFTCMRRYPMAICTFYDSYAP